MPDEQYSATENRPWVIYVLKHPVTEEVKYVGKTSEKTHRRLIMHIWESKTNNKTYKQRGLRKILKLGLLPIMEVVESGTGDGWVEA